MTDFYTDCITLPYKKQGSGDSHIYVDIYPPPLLENSNTNLLTALPSIPGVIYFHGGGLTVGNRKSWFPKWLHRRVLASGYAFISADYTLIPPGNGHSIVDDIKDLFSFLDKVKVSQTENKKWATFKIDTGAIAVTGSSAGGLCAYLAAMHCKPRAVFSLYGMGGDFLIPHYLSQKTEVFFRGREMLDPANFEEYMHPFCSKLPFISDSALSYHPQTSPTPGYPANRRMQLARLYIQLGVFLDYFTGKHEPSLSSALKDALSNNGRWGSPTSEAFDSISKEVITEQHLPLFPQFSVSPSWPPTMLIHGSADTAVPVTESINLHRLLKEAGVPVELIVLEGKEHSFDYEPGAEEELQEELDNVMAFLKKWLGPDFPFS